jgi:hypothetical protein
MHRSSVGPHGFGVIAIVGGWGECGVAHCFLVRNFCNRIYRRLSGCSILFEVLEFFATRRKFRFKLLIFIEERLVDEARLAVVVIGAGHLRLVFAVGGFIIIGVDRDYRGRAGRGQSLVHDGVRGLLDLGLVVVVGAGFGSDGRHSGWA